MATRSPTENHSFWGSFADLASLNATLTDPRLEVGDTAYVAGTEDSLYAYDGAAWQAVGTGTIAGTIANTEVAFGTAADTIGGSPDMTWDGTQFVVQATAGGITKSVIAGNDATLTVKEEQGADKARLYMTVSGTTSGSVPQIITADEANVTLPLNLGIKDLRAAARPPSPTPTSWTRCSGTTSRQTAQSPSRTRRCRRASRQSATRQASKRLVGR